jgi:ACS family pantothenate transporter-like MFS transporter
MADVTAHDFQLRAITTGFMNSFDFAFVTWWPLIFYPVTDAPNYKMGYIASIVTGSLILPLVLVIAYLEKQGVRKGELGRKFDNNGIEDRESEEQDPNLIAIPDPDK